MKIIEININLSSKRPRAIAANVGNHIKLTRMNRIDQIAREFYSQYGLAMNTVQVLESGLLELYAIHKYIVDGISENDYYKILGNPKR